jgi:hypothetical protein
MNDEHSDPASSPEPAETPTGQSQTNAPQERGGQKLSESGVDYRSIDVLPFQQSGPEEAPEMGGLPTTPDSANQAGPPPADE